MGREERGQSTLPLLNVDRNPKSEIEIDLSANFYDFFDLHK